MNAVVSFTKRNMKVYLRNKSTVFFSFLSMIIIIGLYALFLGNNLTTSLESNYGEIEGINLLVHYWIIGGILAVNAVNVTMSALTTMVMDKEKHQILDFDVSPIKAWQVIFGYIFAAIIIGFFLTVISIIIGQFYLLLVGGALLSLTTILKSLVATATSVIAISSIFFLIYTFIKREQVVSIISTIVGTFIGFMAGVYVPISIMPEYIQDAIKLFPLTYSATMFKNIFVSEQVFNVFGTNSEAINNYNQAMTNVITIKGHDVTFLEMNLILLLTALIFFGISYIIIKRRK